MYDMDQVTAGNTFLGVFCQFALLVGKEFALRNLGDIEHDFLATEKKCSIPIQTSTMEAHVCVSIYRIYLSVCLSIHPSIYPSIHKNRIYIYMYIHIYVYSMYT